MGRGESSRALRLGRYAVFDEIASGGMATVHVGRLLGPAGFSRTVAVKRLYPHLARDPHFASRFLEEARLAARVRHPNVVSIIDVVEHEGEVALIMDFVLGDSLSALLGALASRGLAVPVPIASGILVPILQGLHAAHETRADDGTLLGLVHRDVSPQNIVVGADGVARVLDFGIAKAAAHAPDGTQEGLLKGKLGYLAPEQLQGLEIDRRVDVFSAGVVLWEMLTGTRLFKCATVEETIRKILDHPIVPPSLSSPDVPTALDTVTLQALARDREVRFATASEMAFELERSASPASAAQVAAWLESVAGAKVEALRARVSAVESSPVETSSTPPLAIEPEVGTSPSAVTPAASGNLPPSPRPSGPLPLILAFTGLVAVLSVIGYIRTRPDAATAQGAASAASGTPSKSAPSVAPPVVAPAANPTCPHLDQVTAIASGPAARFTCALREDHSVWCWGSNEAGQIASGRKDMPRATKVARLDASVEVAAGNRHACAVLGDTNVACWGKDLLDHPTRVLGLSDVLHLRCGGRHSCVLRNGGGVSCWGEEDRGQLGTTMQDAALVAAVEGLPPATWISAGTAHSCAVLASDGSVWCWGDNMYGQLGQGRSDREPQARPLRVPSLPPCVQVEAGDKTTFVRTRDGHVYGWGFGIKRPVRLAIEGVTGIGAGGKQNCAIDDQGSVWCWGFNDFGQLGRSTEQDSATPVRVQVPSRATQVVAGEVHVCALIEPGAVVCWGSNEQGQLGIGASDRERHPGPERVRIEGCP